MKQEIKVGQRWSYGQHSQWVLQVTKVDSSEVEMDLIPGGYATETIEEFLEYNTLIEDVAEDTPDDLVWTRKSDGYVPEIKYESDEYVVFVGICGIEFGCIISVWRDCYEKRPRKAPATIEQLKHNAMFTS